MKIVKSDIKVMLTHEEVINAITYWLLVAKQQSLSAISSEVICDPSVHGLDSSYKGGLVLKVFENEQ